MNELDTQVMVGALENRGLRRTHEESGADLLIFNTCSIRDLAERKVMGKLGRLGKLGRNKHKNPIIGITGCMANAKKESLFKKIPYIDFILGTNNIHQLGNVLDEVITTGTQSIRTDDTFSEELDYLSAKRDDKVKAFVAIIRGCDKFCTYCVVPYTRGPESSRSPDAVVEECKKLADDGCKEVTLLGQNVNSYGKDKPEWNCLFHDLLYRIDKESDIQRVRFMTSHPVDITQELMEAVRDLKSLCEFVHFPLQAGSSRILRKMHRIYTLEQYFEKVRMFREIVPNIALGTDIIVGFPTETEQEFEMTCDAMKEIRFSQLYAFAYSARKGTPAKRWVDDVPEEVKQARLARLMQLQKPITATHLQSLLDTTVEVLVEGRSAKDSSCLYGRTRCCKKVIFPGKSGLIGTLQPIAVHSLSNQTLVGNLEVE